ncbi:5377_t:CDS:1, partial [Cetraspora pellucida]
MTNNDIDDHSATCYYCPKNWNNGCPAEMEAHLANICPNAPKDTKEYWQESLSNKVISYKQTK